MGYSVYGWSQGRFTPGDVVFVNTMLMQLFRPLDMIHDLDAVLAFVNSPVKEIRAAGLPILSNKVDIANARIEFESGCVANFTASRVSTERVRKLRFFQPRQYVSIDYGRQDVLIFTVGDAAGTPSANPDIKVSKPSITPEEPLRAELRAFLESVRTRKAPPVPLEDGRRALAVALEVLAQIAAHVKHPGPAAVADGLIRVRKFGRRQPQP